MTSALASDTALGQLPEWNLGDLYAGMDCEELAADIARADNRVSSFQKSWKNSLADLDSNAFQTAIAEYEDIQELLGRIMSYVDLLHASDLSDTSLARFCQTTREQVNDISTGLLFFTIEINEIEDARLEPLLSGPAGRYRRWIETVRAFRPHQLEENQERLLHEKRIAGAGAWTRLFDETLTDLRFDVDDRSMTLEEVLNLLTDRDTDLRRKAAISLGEVLAQNGRVFSLVMNTLAKDKEIEDRWRGFVQPQSSRNLSNQVEDNVVDALNEAVRAAFPDISHRYYRMKASWMHKDVLDHWDRNAPLPEAAAGAISWLEAKDTVLDAYADFSGELADVGRQFFEHDWIDASLREGKASGAFAHPTVPSVHPYLLLNYQGKVRDVMTLAHELGHGVHQVLAAHQGALLSDTPLTLAETASVFGEMLTFRKMLSRETDTLRRKIMLAGKVEDMINTVIRQIALLQFRTPVSQYPTQRRTLRRGDLRPVDRYPVGKSRGRCPARRYISLVLGLHPAFHSFTILCLRLCVRRLSGELSLCRLRNCLRRFR